MYFITKINIILQLIIYLLGIGRNYDSARYMGTFNDPNQFSYFIVLSIAYLYVIEDILKIKKRAHLTYLIGFILVILSASTGMLMACTILITLHFIRTITSMNMWKRNAGRILLVLTVLCAIVCIPMSNLELKNIIKTTINETISDMSIVERMTGKIDKAENSNTALIEERGLDKLINYPQYLIYGAGQGNYSRFENVVNKIEIHSTLPGLWFYYGIIPFVLLLRWIYVNVKNVKFRYMIPYIALLVESFTLYNQRQLLLWVLIIMANLLKEEKMEEEDERVWNKKVATDVQL